MRSVQGFVPFRQFVLKRARGHSGTRFPVGPLNGRRTWIGVGGSSEPFCYGAKNFSFPLISNIRASKIHPEKLFLEPIGIESEARKVCYEVAYNFQAIGQVRFLKTAFVDFNDSPESRIVGDYYWARGMSWVELPLEISPFKNLLFVKGILNRDILKSHKVDFLPHFPLANLFGLLRTSLAYPLSRQFNLLEKPNSPRRVSTLPGCRNVCWIPRSSDR